MRKLLLSAFALLMTLAAGAQTVTSPNGNVSVKFWLQDGRPTYEMSYKKKAVVKPSHLVSSLPKTSTQATARMSRTSWTVLP